jgi:hypothetical protein
MKGHENRANHWEMGGLPLRLELLIQAMAAGTGHFVFVSFVPSKVKFSPFNERF